MNAAILAQFRDRFKAILALSFICLFLYQPVSLFPQLQFSKELYLGPQKGNLTGPTGIVIDSLNSRIYFCTAFFQLGIIDMETKAVIDAIPLEYRPFRLRIMTDIDKLLMSTDGHGKILFLNTKDQVVERAIDIGPPVGGNFPDLCLDAINHEVYAVSERNEITVMDAVDPKIIKRVSTLSNPHRINYFPSTEQIAVGFIDKFKLQIFDKANDYSSQIFQTRGIVAGMEYHSESDLYFLLNYNPHDLRFTLYKLDHNFKYIDSLKFTEQVNNISYGHLEMDIEKGRLIAIAPAIANSVIDIQTFQKIGAWGVEGGQIAYDDSYYYQPGSITPFIFATRRDLSAPQNPIQLRVNFNLSDLYVLEEKNQIYVIEYTGAAFENNENNVVALDNNLKSINSLKRVKGVELIKIIELHDERLLILGEHDFEIINRISFESYFYGHWEDIYADGYEVRNAVYDDSTGLIYFAGSTHNQATGINEGRVALFDAENYTLSTTIDLPELETFPLIVDDFDEKIVFFAASWAEFDPFQAIYKYDIELGEIVESTYPQTNAFSLELDEQNNILYICNLDSNKITKYNYDLSIAGYIESGSPSRVKFNEVNNHIYILGSANEWENYNCTITELDENENLIFYEVLSPESNRDYDGIHINDYSGEVIINNSRTGKLFVYKDDSFAGRPHIPQPMIKTITAGDQQIELEWDFIDDPNVVGYNLYRNDENRSEYILINTELLIDTNFIDLDLTNGLEYSYKITSVDQYNYEGNRSEPSNAIPLELPDFEVNTSDLVKHIVPGGSAEFVFNITRESQFSSVIVATVENLDQVFLYHLDPDTLITGDTFILTVNSDPTDEPQIEEFEITFAGGGQTHIINMQLIISETVEISIFSHPVLPRFNQTLNIIGSVFPKEISDIEIWLKSPTNLSFTKFMTKSDAEGNFQYDIVPEKIGIWHGYARSTLHGDIFSDTLSIVVDRGLTQISCTTDLVDSADVGWIMTVKGCVFPNTGNATASLHIKKPDSTEVEIDGILINENGYYGHNLFIDTPGFWQVTSSWPGNEMFFGAESNILVVPVGVSVGKSIIVTGLSNENGEEFLQAGNSLSNYAYNVLNKRRFDDEDIYYLNNDLNLDANGDGFGEEVDSLPTLENIRSAITEWAAYSGEDSTNSLSIYIFSDGDNLTLKINESEVLHADTLSNWLSLYQLKTNKNHVNLILESPSSGTYSTRIAGTSRCIVTSTGDTLSYLVNEGEISFSHFFWNHIYEGQSIGEAYLETKDEMIGLNVFFASQTPSIFGNEDIIPNESVDVEIANNCFIGGSYLLGDFSPNITGFGSEGGGYAFSSNTGIYKTYTRSNISKEGLKLWANISDAENNISLVGAIIFPPEKMIIKKKNNSAKNQISFPVLNITSLELFDPDNDGRYENFFNDFEEWGMYTYLLYALDESDNISELKILNLLITDSVFTDIIEELELPTSFKLYQNYPNPFNPSTTIPFDLPKESKIEISIFNILGQKIKTIVDKQMRAGHHQVEWNGRNIYGTYVSSGIYFVRIKADRFIFTKKMVFLK